MLEIGRKIWDRERESSNSGGEKNKKKMQWWNKFLVKFPNKLVHYKSDNERKYLHLKI